MTTAIFIVDVGIACAGTTDISAPPVAPERSPRDSDGRWAARQAQYAQKAANWAQARSDAYGAWDEIKAEREDRVRHFVVDSYKGKIHNIIDNSTVDAVKLPDSFTVRIEVNGKCLRDFVLNYPYIFEVVEPEDIELPQRMEAALARDQLAITLTAPDPASPTICVIDSGIQQEHFLLKPAIDNATSHCFLPNTAADEVGD